MLNRLLALGVLATVSTGCSFAAVHGPPVPAPGAPPPAEPNCTTSHAAPALDLLLGGIMAIVTETVFTQRLNGDHTHGYGEKAFSASATVALFSSGITGAKRVEDCRKSLEPAAAMAELSPALSFEGLSALSAPSSRCRTDGLAQAGARGFPCAPSPGRAGRCTADAPAPAREAPASCGPPRRGQSPCP